MEILLSPEERTFYERAFHHSRGWPGDLDWRAWDIGLPPAPYAGGASGLDDGQKIAKHLGLNEQQKAKLGAVKDEVLAARAESKKEHRAIMEAVLAQVQSDRLDQAKLAQLIEQHQAEQTRVMQRALPKVADWHATLRPERKAEAVEHIRRWMERHGDY